jgi:Ca2+-binding RTX toxin-like protein
MPILSTTLAAAAGLSVTPVQGHSDRNYYVLEAGPHDGTLSITGFMAGRAGDVLSVDRLLDQIGLNPFASTGPLRLIQRAADTVLQQRADAGAAFEDVLTLKNVDRTTLTPDNVANGLNPDGSQRGLDLAATDANERIVGGWLDDRIDGGGGNDVLFGSLGNDRLIGGAGNDVLEGDRMENGDAFPQFVPWDSSVTGDDRLEGGAGDDVLVSFWGNDVLLGGAGRDLLSLSVSLSIAQPVFHSTLDGGDGDDHLRVTRDFDGRTTVELTGGAGSDLFSIDATAGRGSLTILDFQAGAGGDVLDVFKLLPWGVVKQLADSYFRFVQRGADTVVQFDGDRSGTEHDFEDIVILRNIASNTLVAENMRYGYLPGVATAAGQRYNGTDGADRLQGGLGNDHLDGGAGNDILVGGGGSDILDGGRGLDSVHYDGVRFDYEIWFAADGRWVDDKRGGVQGGRDALFNVERLVFADGALALDIGDTGVAAQTYRLYRAAFDRTPDDAGLGFWINRIDAGVPLVAVADAFIRSAEFRDLYGAAPSNTEMLHALYMNVLDREPDPDGFAFWLDVLDNERAPFSEVLLGFSNSSENIGATVHLIAQGIAYQPYIG